LRRSVLTEVDVLPLPVTATATACSVTVCGAVAWQNMLMLSVCEAEFAA
jgi:hypothetical protein